MDGSINFESLDTSYVSLASLIRYLRERDFVGRVHVALDQYEADIFLYGSDSPSVWESDHATGRGAQGDAAMERLLVRAREPGGLITVYERVEPEHSAESEHTAPEPTSENSAAEQAAESETITDSSVDLGAAIETPKVEPPRENVDWYKLLRVSGELIAAVERAVESAGGDFSGNFRAARVELGDDYPFLDPSVGGFEYANAVVQLRERPAASAYIASLSESLRRIVNKLAKDDRDGVRLRERVAVELAVVARKHGNSLAEFKPHLDRIAGTRVL
jgi:hypothetical protein